MKNSDKIFEESKFLSKKFEKFYCFQSYTTKTRNEN